VLRPRPPPHIRSSPLKNVQTVKKLGKLLPNGKNVNFCIACL
jgi:hypothetical protein